MRGGSVDQIRIALVNRLRSRREEIERAALVRVKAVSGPDTEADKGYARGLKVAVSAALDYGIAALGRSEDRTPPIPTALLAQARLAARAGISLDTVLRRYLAGYTLLGDYVLQEAESGRFRTGELQRLQRTQAALLDRVLAAVGEEYGREQRSRLANAEERRADRVKRLLAGELLDTSGLAYDFDQHHLGVIASEAGAGKAMRSFARSGDYRLLLVQREEGADWAWLGSRRGIDPAEVERGLKRCLPAGVALALGHPARGLAGWRQTHRQARAALPIALRGPERLVRYADVAVLASLLRDELLITSLADLYLKPLAEERDGGATLRATLEAYFAAERNLTSAAAALGVSRRTVGNRLQVIEGRLGRSLGEIGLELEAVLRLSALTTKEPAPVTRSEPASAFTHR